MNNSVVGFFENVRWPSGSTECFSHTTTRGRQFDIQGQRGDIDYTLVDHRSTTENPLQLMCSCADVSVVDRGCVDVIGVDGNCVDVLAVDMSVQWSDKRWSDEIWITMKIPPLSSMFWVEMLLPPLCLLGLSFVSLGNFTDLGCRLRLLRKQLRKLTYLFIKKENRDSHKLPAFLEVQGIPEAEEARGYALATMTKREKLEG
ncbi:hypothetical protein HID58_044544 [Brassica napus]|uniref:Uncharacterized protein n=1 Tax=Brassica napus TaxID=3708 RepID=A0ABQ8BJN8_BRANA|nr:hypothetical protein HID58_044544 [Brassica napus]